MSYQIDNITKDTTCFLCEGKLKLLPNNIDSEKQRIIDYYPNWLPDTYTGRHDEYDSQ